MYGIMDDFLLEIDLNNTDCLVVVESQNSSRHVAEENSVKPSQPKSLIQSTAGTFWYFWYFFTNQFFC